MDLEEQLLTLEEGFWTGDADFYRRNLSADSLMVFAAPVGILDKESTVRAITQSPRWAEVELRDVRFVHLSPDVAILAYTAEARREGGDSIYRTLASSAYVRRGGAWQLGWHQQTPSGGNEGA